MIGKYSENRETSVRIQGVEGQRVQVKGLKSGFITTRSLRSLEAQSTEGILFYLQGDIMKTYLCELCACGEIIKRSIKSKRLKAGWNNDYLTKVVFG